MLTDLYPRAADRYRSLPVLGPLVDGFAQSLEEQGYRRGSRRLMIRALRQIAELLQRCGCHQLPALTREGLRACAPTDSQADRVLAGTVHALERYLDQVGALPVPSPEPPTPTGVLLDAYADFLRDVRGLVHSTVADHLATAKAFLAQRTGEPTPERLSALTGSDIEAFLRWRGPQVGRGTLQHLASELRGFLRFLASTGRHCPGLDGCVDTPRLYRGEPLSRALPWSTVQGFLQAIDRSTPMGLRDYAMFSLIATYGLRASEVVALTLDDIDWRAEQLRIPQRKTASTLLLPLTEAVGDLLVAYLRHGRPALPVRQVFLRARAPAGALKPTAVVEAFQHWRAGSGLAIPFQGPHCLRHAYAVHLLRCGTPLKTIGDLLGHRRTESTCVYLRLALEDLREVPLNLPAEAHS
jgi:site-specific recombinase XerD